MSALRKAGAAPPRKGGGTESRVTVDGFHSQQEGQSSSTPSLLSSSAMPSARQGHEHEGPESVGKAARPQPSPRGSRHQPSKTPARPLAVLEVTNKRGKGIFNEHEERALVRLCTGVESLLRSKAADVSLLWSGMTERTLIRNSNNRGGAGGAWSNHARVESTIMRLYSEASFPADAVALRRQHSERSVAEGRQRALSDSTNDSFVDLAKKSGGSPERNAHGSGPETPAVDDDVSRVHRIFEEGSELVDLSMSLFEMGSEQLLSFVARFFRNMELTDMFQVSFFKLVFLLWVRLTVVLPLPPFVPRRVLPGSIARAMGWTRTGAVSSALLQRMARCAYSPAILGQCAGAVLGLALPRIGAELMMDHT